MSNKEKWRCLKSLLESILSFIRQNQVFPKFENENHRILQLCYAWVKYEFSNYSQEIQCDKAKNVLVFLQNYKRKP